MIRRVVGAMTGTSLDALDTAWVELDGHGLEMSGRLLGHRAVPLGALGPQLRRAAEQEPLPARVFAELAWALGELHAETAAALTGGERPDLVAVHGQTVAHDPPISWQLINTAPIAARLRCDVIADLRQADLATGGEGAPITPLADWVLLRGPHRRAVVNLGGFCNITVLPPRDHRDPCTAIEGFDVCACNHLLDGVARCALDAPYDEDGAAATRGKADTSAAATLQTLLRGQRGKQRSLGTGDEAGSWIDAAHDHLAPDDLAATAVHGVAQAIATSIAPFDPNDVLLAGGGTRNRALVAALRGACRGSVSLTDDAGLPAAAREAAAMAILGALSTDGVPITLPRITGCAAPSPVAGMTARGGV